MSRSDSLRSANLLKARKKNTRFSVEAERSSFNFIVTAVNNHLIDHLNERISNKRKQKLVPVVKEVIQEKGFYVPGITLDALSEKVTEALTGYEKHHHLIANKDISNIVIHDYRRTYIMENLKWRPLNISFDSPESFNKYIERVIRRNGGKYSKAFPMAKVEDMDYNLRIRAVGYDIAPDSPELIIRRLSSEVLSGEKLGYAMSPALEEFLRFCVNAGFNIGIAGTYGSGKTTAMGTLLSWIPKNKHVGLIQSSNEIQKVHPFMSRRMTREIVGEEGRKIVEADLLEFAKQESYDVLTLGEFLNEAAYVMLHMLQQGIMSVFTYHANSPKEAINSYIYMVQMANESRYSNEELINQSAQYNDIMLIMDRLRVRDVVQFTGRVVGGMPEYQSLWEFKINQETRYELKGEWAKHKTPLCEKLRRKAELKGIPVPPEYIERIVVGGLI